MLQYFRTLAPHLNQMRALQRAVRDTSAKLQHVVGPWLAGFFTPDRNQGELEPNEHAIHSLASELQSQGKLAGFLGNLK